MHNRSPRTHNTPRIPVDGAIPKTCGKCGQTKPSKKFSLYYIFDDDTGDKKPMRQANCRTCCNTESTKYTYPCKTCGVLKAKSGLFDGQCINCHKIIKPPANDTPLMQYHALMRTVTNFKTLHTTTKKAKTCR